ncbi:hypothetical protein [Sterolibacterium denitrificans]|nr:hypothetical protein [Sterolibacterium denitrificans]
MAPLFATALEIGTPHGTPVLGNSLHLEFPIGLSGSSALPASNCFYLAPRPDDVDGDFFLKDMRFTLEKRGVGTVLVVKSSRGISSPVIGFRVQVGCDVGVSRDFMFFSSQHEIVAPAKPAAVVQAAAAVVPASASAAAASASASGMAEMTVARNTRLNWLARGLYPSSRPLRDEYRRLMKAANPELFGHATDRVGSVHIPAGTVLRIPPNLPKKDAPAKPGAVPPPAPSAPPTPLAAPAAVPQASASRSDAARVETAPQRATQKTDRLVIGSGQGRVPSLSGQNLRQTLERLEQMMTEKSESDIAMSETLTSLAASFGEVKTYLQGVDERIKRAEAGQLQAQTEIQSLREELHSSFSLVELLLAVVGGSIVGAGLIALFQRRRILAPASPRPDVFPPPAPPAPPASPTPSSGRSATVKTTGPAAALRDATERVDRTDRAERAEPASGRGKAAQTRQEAPAASKASTAAAASAALPDRFAALKKTDAAFPAGSERDNLDNSDNPFNLSTPSIITPAPQASAGKAAEMESGLELPASSETSVVEASAPVTREPLEFRMDAEPDDAAKATGDAEPEPARSFADPVLELADVMTSLGLAKEAAAAVIEHIRQHPDQDPSHWFKVLEIYRNTGNREAFDAATQELRQKLNVAVDDWASDSGKQEKTSLEHYPHLAQNLQALWPRPECEEFLTKLLEDNRDGKRLGFPQAVAAEIVLLRAMLRNSLQIDFPPIGNVANEDAAENAAPVETSRDNSDNTDNTGGLTLADPVEGTAPREIRLLP